MAVPAALWENSRRFLPRGLLDSPYGATEALPVATISADEIEPTSVRGACVGRPVGNTPLPYQGLGYPSAAFSGGQHKVEHLRGKLPPQAGGAGPQHHDVVAPARRGVDPPGRVDVAQ